MTVAHAHLSPLRSLAYALVTILACSCTTGAPLQSVRSGSSANALVPVPDPKLPRVGMWLHPDLEIAEWICSYDTSPANSTIYIHSGIQPSSWRQVAAHSSVVALNNFIFGEPLPWTVFSDTRTYAEYIAAFESFPADSPEGLWYRRLNDNVRTPLANFPRSDDETEKQTIYIYAHMFGYDRARAISLGLTPLDEHSYAWPPKGLDGSWPESFLHDDDGAGTRQARPSFKPPETRTAIANVAYFYLKHFENVGAKVHLSPWREINGYMDTKRCPDDDDTSCGLDTWQDLYDTYEAIANRVSGGDFDRARIALYPTIQLENFIGANRRCINRRVVDQVKQFYRRNAQAGVPFAIGISTYPSIEDGGLDTYQSRLHHLLDNLDSSTPVACDANGDGVIAPNKGIYPSVTTSGMRVPRETPIAIGETSRPPWLSFQIEDASSVKENERLGATMANTHLRYDYHAPDGEPAYPLEFVAFTLGPNWAFPRAINGRKIWLTTASGLARNWLTPMQPLAGQLILDTALDPDGDWDNDGIGSITMDDVTSLPGNGSTLQRANVEEMGYSLDNCPYLPNPSQADADGDGIGDPCDNCTNVANYPQEDWDQDGFGSACDPDVNNDGLIQAEVDLAVVKQCRGTPIDCLAHLAFPDLPPGQSPPDLNGRVMLIADMDADEDVDADDVPAWWMLAANTPLRESGFDCAGTIPCPDPSVVMLRDGQTVTIPDPAPYPFTCSPRALDAPESS